jgi:phosphoesterase RecJ-like protein
MSTIQPHLPIPEPRRSQLAEILDSLRAARHVILTTHINADGDGAGSEVAVAAWLQGRGVRVTIINPTTFPPHLRFLLHDTNLVVEADDPRVATILGDADLALVLDTSEPRRIAPLDQALGGIPTAVIDHHPAGPSVLGRGGVQDPTASAVGELIYDLITLSGDPWPPPATLGVYVAIVSDTGSFRFSNTTPRAHAIAAEMLARGVDPEAVFEKLFATAPLRRLVLLREALANFGRDPTGRIAWITVPKSLTDRLGSTNDDYEGLIEHVRSVEGTRVAILLRETGPSETKISLRSAGATDVNRIARTFGGGGHKKASGATLDLPLDQALERVVEESTRELDS